MALKIRPAGREDSAVILSFIRKLAIYEKLEDEVTATEVQLQETLFGDKPYAEVLLGFDQGRAVAIALFFHNYSTFLAKPGIYLEDLFVDEAYRGRGFGTAMLRELARLAVQRKCGRLEWSVLDWNTPAIDFYKNLGACSMEGWTVNRLSGDALIKMASEND